MIEVKAFVLGLLMLALPADWTQTRSGCAPVAAASIPGAQPVQECSAVWTRGEQEIYAFVWTPLPPRDGGPMVEAESWPVVFLGHGTRIVHTKTFMGMDQDVLTAAVHIDAPSANVLVYARGVPLDEFRTLIEGALQATEPAKP